MPKADRYSKSLMHKTDVCFTVFTPNTNFLITASVDGVVKFWKKVAETVEFVKEFKAHEGAVRSISVSYDGKLLATAGPDKLVKLFDVENFDMYGMLQLTFTPKCLCWVYGRGSPFPLLAVSDDESSHVSTYDGRGTTHEPIDTVLTIHNSPVHCIVYNSKYGCAVSADGSGQVEYWKPKPDFKRPDTVWKSKSKTDFFDYKRVKSVPATMSISPDGEKLAMYSLPNREVRVFKFVTGKMMRKCDESIATLKAQQKDDTAPLSLDFDTAADQPRDPVKELKEFNRRVEIEEDIDRQTGLRNRTNVVWDESSNFIFYGSLYGVKVYNTWTGKLLRTYGAKEAYRPLNLTIFQGVPEKKKIVTAAMAASENPLLQEAAAKEAMLVTAGFCKPLKGSADAEGNARFYMTSNDVSQDVPRPSKTRDVRNEKLGTGPAAKKAAQAAAAKALASVATMHTSYGDIKLLLEPDLAPKAVENFVTHSRNGYYNNVIFHRVIPKFMIQTGDPMGDGTGGESIWGKEFANEISSLKHEKYALSMANAGPNTNASQFFITTERATWLDGLHTVFGRVVGGFEVVHSIENARRVKEKPADDIYLINIEVE